MATLSLVLLIIAAVCFGFAVIPTVEPHRVRLIALGLCLWVVSILVTRF